jgi:hypothetical protein
MDASLMSTAGNQRKSKPRVRVLPEEGYILDLSVCSCAALPAFRSRSQQAESQRPNPSIRFTRKARSFSTEKQGRSRAGPGTGRPVPHPPAASFPRSRSPRRCCCLSPLHSAAVRWDGRIARGGQWLPHARADFVRICWVRAALEEGESCVAKVPPCFASSVSRGGWETDVDGPLFRFQPLDADCP